MDFYSLFPGFVEINASPGLILVIDKLFGETSYDTVLNWKMALMFVYGSLPRPSDVESFGVCMWFLTLLSSNVDSGTLFIVDHIALWKHLASTYALSEGELRLESLMHIVQYVQELCTDSEDKDDLANMGFFFDCQVLLQRQNRDCGFIGYTFVARSTWFRSILEFLYCSLPRPPEDLCDFNFPTSHGVFKSKMQVPSILRGSIRDIDLVGLVMV